MMSFFIDDSHFGVPHRDKVEIGDHQTSDGDDAVVHLYTRATLKAPWTMKQSLVVKKTTSLPTDPRVVDMNRDGFRDVTFVSSIAGRGANEIRRLIIYDPRTDKLVDIENSDEYPNLRFNAMLKCLDAWLVTAGTTTIFLHLNGNLLKEFAEVDNSDLGTRTVTVIDEQGHKRVVRTDKIREKALYTRYTQFDPPQ